MGYAQCAEEIDGWMNPDELRLLRNFAMQSESVIEIGSWKGRSSWALLESCNQGNGGPVWCVDSWQGANDGNNHAYDELAYVDMHKVFLGNVGHFPNLKVAKGVSWEVAHMTPPQVDMVFIDADHSYEGCFRDLMSYGVKAKKFLLGHDYSWTGVRQALAKAFPAGSYTNPVGDIWVYQGKMPWTLKM